MTLPYHGSQGGSKIQEAHLIFQDLSEKYPPTCTILNGKALCSMHMGNFEDAEGLLLESLNKVSSGDLFAQTGASFAEHSTPSQHTPMSCFCNRILDLFFLVLKRNR